MDGYQLRTEKKKEQIIRASSELFSTYGVEKVSINEIAKKARVSPVTIYNYFGNKEVLIRSVMVNLMNKTMETYEKILEENLPFPNKMEKIIFDHPNTVKELNFDFIRANVNDSAFRAFIEDFYREKTIPFFRKMIDLGKKEGYIDPSISMEAILFYIQIFKEALAQPELFSYTNQGILQEINRLFYYGLMGKSQRSETKHDE
ncbi:TetR/AcrR family transcriptional regulator [Thermoflavimicrobium daqui]|uniref:TetR family transcriptional regulator n=1 Tax=Thermoflavimicrobium daqui TaxID=2137476 RepID=A0A364K7T2_9BACL|nr:TetR/AcrR family transcriptional regulator [Thermoflavimicrobium daqui]RAL26356.1 TetR family transcriptional regulator [Thermoflavimicrobium daqui]